MKDRLKASLAEVLAVALCRLFPEVRLISSKIAPEGFFYEFYFPYPMMEDFLSLVERTMKDILKEQIPIESFEMTPQNAAEYLTHLKRHKDLEFLRQNPDSLVTLWKMGDFIDYCPYPFCQEFSEIPVFSLLKIEQNASDYVCIWGDVFADSKEKKQKVKALKEWEKNNFRTRGEDKKLFFFEEEAVFWLSKGKIVKEILKKLWQKELEDQRFFFIETPSIVTSTESAIDESFKSIEKILKEKSLFHQKIQKFHQKTDKTQESPRKIPEKAPVLDKFAEMDRDFCIETIFCPKKKLIEEVISSLKFIEKMLTIFSLNFTWSFYGKELERNNQLERDNQRGHRSQEGQEKQESILKAIEESGIKIEKKLEAKEGFQSFFELKIQDKLGREWIGAYLGIIEDLSDKQKFLYSKKPEAMEEKKSCIVRSSLGDIGERVFVLLELDEDLAFWMIPKQVGIFPIKEEDREEAKEIKRFLEKEDFRIEIEETGQLDKRVKSFFSEGGRVAIFFGEKERKAKKLSFLEKDQEALFLTKEECIEKLKTMRG